MPGPIIISVKSTEIMIGPGYVSNEFNDRDIQLLEKRYNPGKSLLTKWWFDGWHLPPGIFRYQQGYILKTAVIFGEYLKLLKIFVKKNPNWERKKQKKHTFLG